MNTGMATERTNLTDLPAAVEACLDQARRDLQRRRIDRLHLAPLILREPLAALIGRRRRLFDSVTFERMDYGHEVRFRRRLKRTEKHPEGRECLGSFKLLELSDHLVLTASDLTGDDHKHGPSRFADKAYPLARRPFFRSVVLIDLIETFSKEHGYTPRALDTWAYHRKSRKLRRDLERQPPSTAAREMAEQNRFVHQMLVSFRNQEVEAAKLSFDRHATLNVIKGDPALAVRALLLAGIQKSLASDATYQVERTVKQDQQQIVALNFPEAPFDSYDAMRSLCSAVRQCDGLNVSIVHLNPYLQAQILDFFTGAAVEMLVTDERNVSLIPRSSRSSVALQRVATAILSHFGEAKPKRMRLVDA